MPAPGMKKAIQAAARHSRVLPLLERARYWHIERKTQADNAAFVREHPQFRQPPTLWMHDMYSHTSFRQYWLTGQRDAKTLLGVATEHAESEIHDVVEWGCGLARILRHFPDSMSRMGYDYNPQAIAWSSENIDGVQFETNDLLPPLTRADNSCDLVYAVSVLTHLSERAGEQWLAQICRILRPGGLFLFTVHGPAQTASLLPGEKRRFDDHELVVRGHVKEGSRIFTAYHPDRYVTERLARGFELTSEPMAALGQTLWVARKPL